MSNDLKKTQDDVKMFNESESKKTSIPTASPTVMQQRLIEYKKRVQKNPRRHSVSTLPSGEGMDWDPCTDNLLVLALVDCLALDIQRGMEQKIPIDKDPLRCLCECEFHNVSLQKEAINPPVPTVSPVSTTNSNQPTQTKTEESVSKKPKLGSGAETKSVPVQANMGKPYEIYIFLHNLRSNCSASIPIMILSYIKLKEWFLSSRSYLTNENWKTAWILCMMFTLKLYTDEHRLDELLLTEYPLLPLPILRKFEVLFLEPLAQYVPVTIYIRYYFILHHHIQKINPVPWVPPETILQENNLTLLQKVCLIDASIRH